MVAMGVTGVPGVPGEGAGGASIVVLCRGGGQFNGNQNSYERGDSGTGAAGQALESVNDGCD